MAKIRYVAVAHQFIENVRTRNVSLIEIFETINVPQFPFVIGGFVVAICWDREVDGPEVFNTRFGLDVPGKEGLTFSDPYEVNFNNTQFVRSIVNVPFVQVEEAGDVFIKVQVEDKEKSWENVHDYRLLLMLQSPEQGHKPDMSSDKAET